MAEIDATAMAEVFTVNAIGPALILRHLPRLLRRDAPALAAVLTARVGSIGDNRLGGWYSYRASKAAANQIVHTAAIELARTHRQAALAASPPDGWTSWRKLWVSAASRRARSRSCERISTSG